MIIFDVLGPVWPVFSHCQLQPRFHVPVVMDNSSIVYLWEINTRVITQAKYMPRFVQRMCQLIECQKSWRKCPKLPQNPVFILDTKKVKNKRELNHTNRGRLSTFVFSCNGQWKDMNIAINDRNATGNWDSLCWHSGSHSQIMKYKI